MPIDVRCIITVLFENKTVCKNIIIFYAMYLHIELTIFDTTRKTYHRISSLITENANLNFKTTKVHVSFNL